MQSTMVKAIVEDFGNGGTIDGDLTISGDLTVSGGGSLSFDEVIEGTQVIDVTNTEALLVRKNSDGGDVFVVDTQNTRVGVGVTPTTPMHIKVDNSTTDTTNGLLIEQDGTGDAVAQFLLTGTKRYMMGIDNSDSDNFVINTGAGDLSSGNRLTFDSDMNAVFPGTLTVNGTQVDIQNATADRPILNIENQNADNSPSAIHLYKNSSSPANSDQIGDISWYAKDDGGTKTRLLLLRGFQTDVAASSDDAKLSMYTAKAGSEVETLTLKSGVVQIGTAGNVTDVPLMVNNKILIHQDSGGAGDSELTFDRRHDGAYARIQAKAGASGAMGTELHFVTKTAGGSEGTRLVIDDYGNVGIGTQNPASAAGANALDIIDTNTSSSSQGASLRLGSNDGGAMGDDHRLGVISFRGSEDGAGTMTEGARIDAICDAAWSATENGASLRFFTTDGNASETERLRIASDGALTIDGVKVTTEGTNQRLKFHGSGDNYILTGCYEDNGWGYFNSYNNANGIQFYTGAGGFYFNNGNVGIGIDSADTNLHVYKASAGTISAHSDSVLAVENSGNTAITILSGNSSHGQIHFGDDGQNDDGVVGYDQTTSKFYVLTNHSTTKRLVVDANGNTGFNVTPEADWLPTRTALQIGGSGAIFGATAAGAGGTFNIGQNVYFHSGGSYRRIDEDEVSMYTQRDGTHTFKVAGSSTDNSTISFTDVAKFDINSRISLSSNDSGGTGGADSTSANTVFGYLAGTIDSGSVRNTFIGHKAGFGTLSDATDNTCIGHGTGIELSSGDNNVLIGSYSGYNINSGSDNVSIGKSAGNAFNSSNIIAIGTSSLATINNATANGTVAVGYKALMSMTSAAGNTAIGQETMGVHTTGGKNVAIGHQVMYDTDAGSTSLGSSENVFIGYQVASGTWTDSACNHNVGIGNDVMRGALDGANYSVAIGSEALMSLTTANGNIAIGYQAGTAINTGVHNICIGYQAGSNIQSGRGSVCIGTGAAPSSASVNEEIVLSAGTDAVGGGGTETIRIGVDSDHITNDFGENATWTHSSDERIKKEIKDNTLGLDFINDLRTVTFKKKAPSEYPKEFDTYNETKTKRKNPDRVNYGFIAQEVKASMDKAGHSEFPVWKENADTMQELGETELITPLVKAIQELTARVKELESKL
jgi:hypothetical protein